MSALLRITDSSRTSSHVRKVPTPEVIPLAYSVGITDITLCNASRMALLSHILLSGRIRVIACASHDRSLKNDDPTRCSD